MKDYQNLVVLPLRRCISHAVPSAQLLKALAKLGPMVEVGAGSGYWSAMLHERGVDAIAYDLDPPDASTLANAFAFRPFATVRRADGASLFAADPQLARERTLIMVWPGQWAVGVAPASIDKDTGERIEPPGWETACLNAYLEAGGQTVVYVGEREEAIEKVAGTAPDTGVSASKAFSVSSSTDAPRGDLRRAASLLHVRRHDGLEAAMKVCLTVRHILNIRTVCVLLYRKAVHVYVVSCLGESNQG